MTTITQSNRIRLQSHLRRALHSPGLTLTEPTTKGGGVEVHMGHELLGTVDQVDEDGERSWAVTLIVLAEDLE